jgi:hypothetical protein
MTKMSTVDKRRREQIVVRVTQHEKSYIEKSAAACNLTPSQYVRSRLLQLSKKVRL